MKTTGWEKILSDGFSPRLNQHFTLVLGTGYPGSPSGLRSLAYRSVSCGLPWIHMNISLGGGSDGEGPEG